MELKQAIGTLEMHNRWRRGEDVEPMLKPTDIGIAIDTVVEYIKNNGVLDDVIVSQNCHCYNCQSTNIKTTKYKCRDCKYKGRKG